LRILIDECLPVQLRHIFVGHDARTVVHMSWRSLSNGELLAAAEREQFDLFITADARIPSTHDIGRSRLAVLVVPTNRRKVLDQITNSILDAVAQAKPGEVFIVSLPRLGRRPRRPRAR
jgi:hypothetical protein